MEGKIKFICGGCKTERVVPEKNQDGIFYKWYRCVCGHETELNPRGSYTVPENYASEFEAQNIKEISKGVVVGSEINEKTFRNFRWAEYETKYADKEIKQ